MSTATSRQPVRVDWGTRRGIAAGLIFIVLIVAGVGMVYFGAMQAGPSWSAAQSQGVPGTAVITDESCSRRCQYHGDFTSDDGALTFTNVLIVGGGTTEGQRLRALYDGNGEAPSEVYVPGWGGLVEAALLLGGGLFLIGHSVRRLSPARPVARREPSWGLETFA